MSETFQVPAVGTIQGKTGKEEGTVQFLGIKYAEIAHLFAPSKVVEYSGTDTFDGTQLGPMVPGPPAWDNEFGFIQKSLPMPEMKISDLEGLNLNVTVPLIDGKLPGKERKLPVFVFVHGGGFMLGANSWPTYDQARFVKMSIEMEMPIIGVGINYRVGLPGCLTSQEMRDTGLLSNNGIRDQINAFRWVRKYISSFGGDPESVTFCGESAGSVSGCLLLHQKEQLFKRYIAMSGTTLLMKPQPPAFSEMMYSAIMQHLGLSQLSGPERVKALISLPTEKLIEAAGSGLPIHPVVDGDVIPLAVTFAQLGSPGLEAELPGRKWCSELLVGDCGLDGSITSFMISPAVKKNFTTAFRSSILTSLGPIHGSALLAAYSLGPEVPPAEALRKVLRFTSDIGFFAPAVTLARGWPGKAWLYHFNEPNPWEGEFKGEAGHVLDVAYLFQNFNEELEQKNIRVAKAFARAFIEFAGGRMEGQRERGWGDFGGEEGAMVFDGRVGEEGMRYVQGVAEEGSGRTKKIWELGESVGLQEMNAARDNFLAGK